MASFRTLCLVFLICIIVLTHVDHVDANIFTYTIGRAIQKMTSKRGNPEKYRKKERMHGNTRRRKAVHL